MSNGHGMVMRMQLGRARMLCEHSILIFLKMLEVLYVYVYIMH
jgi:hypothetical protein